MFLSETGRRGDPEPWPIHQAADAVRICHYQVRGAKSDGEGGGPVTGLNDDAAILVRLRQVIRLRHYAKSTEKTYRQWSRRFLECRRGSECEGALTAEDATALLTRLAMVDTVSASIQNQAFSALCLLFRDVLRTDLEAMARTVRAKRGRKLSTVLSVWEVQALLAASARRNWIERTPRCGRRLLEWRPIPRHGRFTDRP